MLRLKSLGQSVIEFDEARVTPAAETVFATGLYLAMEAGRAVGRDELAQLLWPGVSDTQAQHGVRQAIYRLRNFGAKIKADRNSLTLPAKYCSVDFAPLLRTASSSANLEEMVENIGGSFLPGYRPQLSDAFSAWVDQKRDIVHSALLRVLITTLAAKKGRSDWTAAENIAKLCLTIDPLNEEATLTIAEAAVLGGSKARAMTILNRYLEDIGPEAGDIRLPAMMLRRRIFEAFTDEKNVVGDTPFVGRATELAELRTALGEAQRSRGNAYLIRGESGIGKSRLTGEFLRVAALQNVRIISARCQSHDSRRPLSVFIDLVQQLLLLPGALGCSIESMHYLKRLTEVEQLKTNLAFSNNSDGTFEHVRSAIIDLIGAISSEKCVLIEIDDSQWLDGYSQLVLSTLSDWSRQNHVLLLATYSAGTAVEAFANWTRNFYDLHLLPLSREHTDALVDHAARVRHPLSKGFRDWCIASSCGNPFFAIQLASHSLDDGTFKSPTSLAQLIESRLASLSDFSRRVLQTVCLLGRNSKLSILEQVLDQERLDLLTSLDDLEGKGFVELRGENITSRHDLISIAALSRISEASRSLLHRHAAKALEEADFQSATLQYDCAEHWRRAGDSGKAVSVMVRCAENSLNIGLALESARIYEVAADLDRTGIRASLFTSGAYACSIAGEWGEASRLAKLALDETRLSASSQLSEAEAEFFAIQCETALAAYPARSMSKLLKLIREWRMHKALSYHAALCAMMAADNQRDRFLAETVHGIMMEMEDDVSFNNMHRQHGLLVYHCSFGDHSQARTDCAQLVEHARNTKSLDDKARLLDHAGNAAWASGDVAIARSLHREAFQLSSENFAYARAEAAAHSLLSLAISVGRLGEARDWFSKGCEQALLSRRKASSTNTGSFEAELCIREGNFTRARSLITENRTLAKRVATVYATARQRSLESHLLLESTGRISRTQCDRLLELYPMMIGSLKHDYLVVQLIRGMISLNKHDEASAWLTKYLNFDRKTRAPLTHDLMLLRNAQARP